ncbi:MAG: HAMP domain-containing histidine kinase [Oscillospiraceae bacterium]|jgi:signal transduction histidine kinase|nr:HAMP domain-containing histidine kinase [Oscillospiraceae bacterium]
MKSMMKILARYVLSAAGIALILLTVNFGAMIAWIIQSKNVVQHTGDVAQLSDELTLQNGTYAISETALITIDNEYQWAMLIGNNGTVLWSFHLPADVPLHYTLSDVAGFSHWYLNDYPVHVWRRTDSLFVLGSEKGSIFKHGIEAPQSAMDNVLVWIPATLILNGMVAVLLALLFSLRFFRSLKPLAKGIEDMAENHPVTLSTNGILGPLASEINQTSEKLVRQEAALKTRDNARTTWIAGVSHDIRTPLSMVMGYASQLENDPELAPAKRKQAQIIRSQSERIKALVNDLNLASKLEYHMQPLQKDTVLLAALLRGVAADFINGGLPDMFSIEVEISREGQNTAVEGDEKLLKRAVSNLIGNSIKHNPEGCAIKAVLSKNESVCTLSVSDNGVGFRPDVLKSLKLPHALIKLQAHGLGLTIVRQIVKIHSGTVAFHNLPQGGCETILSFPLHCV